MTSNASHTLKGANPDRSALQHVVIVCLGVELEFICLPPEQTVSKSFVNAAVRFLCRT
jgi:hypothetical protein